MKRCYCRVCRNTRRWLGALNPKTDRAKAAFEEILANLECAETDAVYWKLKFKGEWPSKADHAGDVTS